MEENKKFVESREFDKWNKKLDREGISVRLVFSEEAFEKYRNGANFKELVSELKELQKYDNALCNEQGLQVPPETLKASFEEYKQGASIDEIAEQIRLTVEEQYKPLTIEDLPDIKWGLASTELGKRLEKEGLKLSLEVLLDSFEEYRNGADYKDLVKELKEMKKFEDVLWEKEGLQAPLYTLKASFEEYKQGTGIGEIAEQIREGKYDDPFSEKTLADKYWNKNYFDTSLVEGKTFTMYDKKTGEKQFERSLEKFSNEDAFDLEDNSRKSSSWQRFEVTDREGNVLVMGDDSAFKKGAQVLKDVLEYQEKLGITGYEFKDLILEYQEKVGPVSKEHVEHIEAAIKNKGNIIRQEIKSHGFQPTLKLVKNISQLNKITDKSNSLKEISKMYKEKSLQESNPEAQKIVDKIGNELKAQELAKVAPISR